MTLSDDQQPQTPTPQGGGEQSSERSGRRRRRGRRGGPREEGQQTTTDAASPSPAEAGRPQHAPANTTAAPVAGTTAENAGGDQPAGEGGERTSRNRRRNRNRNRAESRDAQSPASGQQQQQPSANPQQGQSQGQQSKDRQSSGKPSQQQRGEQAKPEKKDRPPRGSVLNRRQTRGDYVDTPKQKDEAPTYVPVQAATVEQYVTGHKGWQREVLTTLRSIVQSAAPDVEESIMWSQPVFSMNGPVCFFKAYKDYVTFGFWRGTEISDTEGLLSGDLTMMRTMTLRSAKDVRRETFESMVKQAVRLNREKGDPTLS